MLELSKILKKPLSNDVSEQLKHERDMKKKIKSQQRHRKSLQKIKIQRSTKWEILKLQNIITQIKTE